MAAIGADEKKKLMILGGLILAIIVVVLVLYNPFGGSPEPAPAPVKSAAAPAPARPPGAPAAPAAPTASFASAPGGAAGGATTTRFINPAPWREDPFAPFTIGLTGRPESIPTPRPVPTAVPPVPLPQPQVIVPPEAIPAPFVRPGVGPTLASVGVLTVLPDVRIPQVPRVPTPPSGAFGGSQVGGQVGIARSSNKRLSGIIIGDGVRALLEIGTDEDKVTRIVQPGDEVDGITILRIERTTEGARTTTRLIIREGTEERYVDLRPAPQQPAQGGETGDAPGGGAFGGTPRMGGTPRGFVAPALP